MQVGSPPAAALYDSGADISCISEVELRKIPVEQCPDKQPGHHLDQCFSAGGDQLAVKGVFNLPVTILGNKITQPDKRAERVRNFGSRFHQSASPDL